MSERLGTLDPQRLETALRREGLLGGATVRHLVVESARLTVLSRIVRLRAEYADGGEARGGRSGSCSKPAIPIG